MRIALVCAEVIRESGHGRYMLELARHLATRHEVHVFSHLFQPVEGVVHRPVRAHEGINLLRLLTFWWNSTRALADEPFDVVHTVGGCCARRDVVTAQFCQRAWGAELQAAAVREREARRAGLPVMQPLPSWRRAYHQLYWRVADRFEAPAFQGGGTRALIAVSARVKAELEHAYGVAGERITVVPNGVEPADFADTQLAPLRAPTRAALGLADDAPVLLFVGDFHRKGLAWVLQAVARMQARTAQLIVVGRGDLAAFRALAQRLGVAERTHFVGFQAEPRPYFAAADAFVFPTWYEPFGMVVVEALAAGLPVVTSTLAGASDAVQDGVNGFLLPEPSDVGAIAAHLDGLCLDAPKRLAMARAARDSVTPYAWSRIAARTETVYDEVVQARAARRLGLSGPDSPGTMRRPSR
ncbi:MAG: glycosyltransferase family 4 protein [Candidatus Sericytochromatia bacterium]|nr:glycosyltransferase family 4 protein [Candidatus Sericytochromatia bacterium]